MTTAEYSEAIDLRNQVMLRLCYNTSAFRHLELLSNNDFQAGLDALDPEAPCFINDRAIRNTVVYGLVHMMVEGPKAALGIELL